MNLEAEQSIIRNEDAVARKWNALALRGLHQICNLKPFFQYIYNSKNQHFNNGRRNNMISSSNDWYPEETEYEYEARKTQESRSASGLMSGIAGLLIFALKMGAVFGVFLFIGFLLSRRLFEAGTSTFKTWGFALFFIYLIFCIIYFLKGTIIGLRSSGHKLWVLPWTICVFTCCIIPAFIVKSAVLSMFNLTEQQSILCLVLSWGAFILFLLYTYSIYQFKTPAAPKVLFWSYSLGLKISL